ncbi:MAG TPA: chromosomal replication initiator protein DnaA [Phycisphaerae bacterium]|nr:chromosomal replication initiator protein DnaA [Phycisphaerae bacterium]
MADVDRALWQRIVEQVVAGGGNVIRPWFAHLEPICLDHGLLEIEVPTGAQKTYCTRHATRLFTEAAQAATGRLVGVCFLTPPDIREAQDPADPTSAAVPAEGAEAQLSADYTFETFVAGPCNRLAHAACTAVTEAPGKSYNPLFVHGSAGLGKTHLLHATCSRIRQERAELNICLLSCETFVNHFIESVERGQLHEFRFRYRHADLLVIDDIQFLAGHEQSQEEFFHTFNTLYQAQRQIILTSDRGPGQIPELEERLVSRFNWGLVARIDRPCYETRVAIVKKKARIRCIELPEAVACFLAARIDSNTRELEGAITKVAMLAQVSERDIDLSLAREALGGEDGVPRPEITIDDILTVVSSRFDVRLTDLQSKKRTRSVALPRQICMYLARSLTRHSLGEIGGYFGGRDHTTVLHAKRTIEAHRTSDPQLQATLDRLTEELRKGT